MTHIQRNHTNQRMSKIVVHNDTLCSQVGVKDTSVVEQTAEALSRVETLLIKEGSDKDDVLETTV
ncbi:hypothetical protein L1D34_28005 [Vibrio mediterranei]|jgi:enamine deaminase RidA (YjgF/YER057c/UK114 family)|nr:hypothetical protein [Vibrio mediterranei]MCG9628656.1 hypothetical protein [Vibrio mediterranei]MCY9856157.1 hypothetical protein [Vibrio mediterranei]